MCCSRPAAVKWFTVLALVTAPALAAGQDHILGFQTLGGYVNTKELVVRRPPIKSGSVSSQSSQYASVGSWTEKGSFKGDYTYTVSVKASGSWSPASKKMTETLVATITNFKDYAKSNGTWEFTSTATCAQDPWRFPVKCTAPQVAVKTPPGSGPDALMAAVSYPLSAAGGLTAAELGVVTITEVVSPKANETVPDKAQVTVKVQLHDVATASKNGQVRFDIRPYGSSDFPTPETQKSYLSKSIPAYIGGSASTFFDLSGLDATDWQVAGSFSQGLSTTRSPWVRFRTKARLATLPTILNLEAESLAASPPGAVVVQQMQQFGTNWSNNAHLLWGATGYGDTIVLTFDVPVASTYSAELYMTRAPDFGDAEVTISDRPGVLKFVGFSPKVMSSGPIQMGKYQLSAGTNTLRFRITGKYKDSKGFRLGIDRLRLYPAPAR